MEEVVDMRKEVSTYFKDHISKVGKYRPLPIRVALPCISPVMVESLSFGFAPFEIEVVIAGIVG